MKCFDTNVIFLSDESDEILLQNLPKNQSLDEETQEEEHKDQQQKPSGQEKEDGCIPVSGEASP